MLGRQFGGYEMNYKDKRGMTVGTIVHLGTNDFRKGNESFCDIDPKRKAELM